ncbi:EamA family transporter RarD [Agrobacterium tumefaciens]|jgi:chloramphenicol-sensitive protein RarD|uniref:Chloramphenicol-sensitive protein RarD n=3 Tax=Agrobacterium TaxID=357 RepID=A0A2L2LA29_AGRTU|nr:MULTISPECIES: EamA family transporter RarD [Rhizobium/Agrobacterium group]MBS0258696.1 EamA family transporter RarD [Pseudomonadota bacterium]MCZ7493296.1 EamA family transporter RarD [Rhizobium rhizogenes]AVH41169.1 chloramphenicol-sensitive protein RarD [Agrobacterium tumefaciens]KVK55929.1 permease [Agrobacterium sp. D14]MBG0510296.1 EamA family transporter RarD [Agrobacterium leguminum]
MALDKSLPAQEGGDSARGFAFALSAYLLWGFLPFYMKAVAHISPIEVIVHRVVWSVPIAAVVLIALGRTAEIRTALRTPKMLAMASLTAILISINWGVYIWAIGAGRALDAALGYFINPLFSIFLGAVLLKEKLYPAQIAAIGLVALAVAILTWHAGSLPWVSIALTVSWGFYAFFRKTLPIGATQGFLLEVMLLSIPAVLVMIWLAFNGQAHFMGGNSADTWLLATSGLITAVPLILYGNGAKLLRLSTIGIMQYIAPTMIFLIAIFVFKEPFDMVRMAAFAMIWVALAIYTGSSLLRLKR